MKQLKTIVTFPNTHAALAAEQFLETYKLQARIIPVPVEISAECGLALCMNPDVEEQFKTYASEVSLVYSQIYTIEI